MLTCTSGWPSQLARLVHCRPSHLASSRCSAVDGNVGEPLVPGKFYDLTFDLQPDDEFVPAGKQLAVMIMSSDREFTLWPKAGTELTIDLAHSSFSIPIVGGTAALAKAGNR